MNHQQTLIDAIDAILPQTQCELCGYKGCKPYAKAIVKQHESIDKCLPGGMDTLHQIADLTAQDPTPYQNSMNQKAKPAMIARIREDECIGCTKCIQACPVDAIIGASKQMHTVIESCCSGCELCIAPCPVDCIDLITIAERSPSEKNRFAKQCRQRFEKRQTRLTQQALVHQQKHQTAKQSHSSNNKLSIKARQQAIGQILQRVKQRR